MNNGELERRIIQQQFGAHAADYVASKPHAHGASLKRLVELIQPQAHWRALDVATGAGYTAFTFAPHVAQVWATDITQEMLALVKRGAQERKFHNLIVEFADAEHLPFLEGSFELVTCRIAPHHFMDVGSFMFEVARVLKPGGTLAVVDNVVPQGAVGDYINAFEKLRDPSHGRCLDMLEWSQAFEAAGILLNHQEIADKQMHFEDWAARHGVVMQRYLRAMLVHGPADVSAVLRPEMIGGNITFMLQEAILIGKSLA